MNLNDLLVPVAVVAPMIIGMVEFLKKFGIEGKKLTISAFILGAVIALLAWVYVTFPEAQLYVRAVFIALGGGMVATGLYDFLDKRFPPIKE